MLEGRLVRSTGDFYVNITHKSPRWIEMGKVDSRARAFDRPIGPNDAFLQQFVCQFRTRTKLIIKYLDDDFFCKRIFKKDFLKPALLA